MSAYKIPLTYYRQLFTESGPSRKKKQPAHKKKLGVVSSSLFIAQAAKKEKELQEKENTAPNALTTLAEVAHNTARSSNVPRTK